MPQTPPHIRIRMKTNDPFSMDISRHIWETRYRTRGEADIHTSWQRVAQAIAQAEGDERDLWAERFHALLDDFRFLPGGRILAGAGTGTPGDAVQLLRHGRDRRRPRAAFSRR